MKISGKRIVVVEDDPINMAVIAVTLKTSGALVIQDNWNTDTINRIRDMMPVDLILMDLMLRHGVSGYDIFKKLQDYPGLADIPVIVVSASDPSMEMNKAREMGFAGYIPKPIRRGSFVSSIENVLSGHSSWADEAA